jgi:DNA-binding MarR family transcriptional regulator
METADVMTGVSRAGSGSGAGARSRAGAAAPGLPDALVGEAGFLIAQAAEFARAVFAGELPPGVSPRYASFLTFLDSAGPTSQNTVGRVLRLERSTLSAVSDALERARLIYRRRDPVDRRLNELTLTEEGRATVALIREASARANKRLLRALDDGQRADLVALLTALLEQEPDTAGRHSGP